MENLSCLRMKKESLVMYLFHYVSDIFCFIVLLVTLDIIWTNIKGYGAERKYGWCFAYAAGGIAVFFVLLAISTAIRNFLS